MYANTSSDETAIFIILQERKVGSILQVIISQNIEMVSCFGKTKTTRYTRKPSLLIADVGSITCALFGNAFLPRIAESRLSLN